MYVLRLIHSLCLMYDCIIALMGILPACCQGFVAVDKEASTARLAHINLPLTTAFFLCLHPELLGTTKSIIGEKYSRCVNSQEVKAPSTASTPNLQHLPFLDLQRALPLNP